MTTMKRLIHDILWRISRRYRGRCIVARFHWGDA
jgi:hypothetical protein